MKAVFIAVVIALFCIPAYGSHGLKGSREMLLDFNYRDGDWALGLGYGMFLTDNTAAGGMVSYNDARDTWQASAKVERLFLAGRTHLMPYVSAVVAYADMDFDDTFLYGPSAGMLQLLTDYLAVDLNVRYLFGSADWYDEEIEVSAGMRFLF